MSTERNLMTDALKAIAKLVVDWLASRGDIRGIALIGSYARNEALPHSDIDFLIIAHHSDAFRDPEWVFEINWLSTGRYPITWCDEEYGAVWSRRVWFQPDGEAEFAFAKISWAEASPVDPGTSKVVAGGCQILYDPDESLGRLMLALTCSMS
ncbi:MAG: nucleotidyltransferase domain-containing protein [Acidobacteria bacterium]|nr:nucleotidyltransferase domain-containing protein [Acidobacteriota bacterium]